MSQKVRKIYANVLVPHASGAEPLGVEGELYFEVPNGQKLRLVVYKVPRERLHEIEISELIATVRDTIQYRTGHEVEVIVIPQEWDLVFYEL
jgi:hypothetical protein